MASIALTWKNHSVSIDGQRLYRSETPFDTSNLPEVLTVLGPEVDKFVDDSVVYGRKYWYMVEAYLGDRVLFSDVFDIDTTDYPQTSGVGPKNLIGFNSDHCGFFGEVPVTDLINGVDLASMIGLTAGTAQNNTDPWLKFIIDGKIYFVAKKTYRHTVSWDHIQAVNAVYGGRVIQIGDYRYRIGLLKGADTDPATFTAGHNPPGTLESEWNRLMYNVAKDLSSFPKAGQIGENWAEYEQSNVAGGLGISAGDGRYSWCQETNASSAGQRVCRGIYSVTNSRFNSSSSANADYGWRPRLELVTS